MDEFMNIINTMGYPIALSIAFLYYMYSDRKQDREDVKVREENANKQIEKFGDSLEKFNTTLLLIEKRLENLENTLKK